MAQRYLHVVDNFYPNPDLIRKHAMKLRYDAGDPMLTGIRTIAFHPDGIKDHIEKIFRIKIKTWETSAGSANGAFFAALGKGRLAETVGVHYDEPVTWMTMLIYLTPEADFGAGTSFWQHIRTGLIARPTTKDAKRLGIPLEKLTTAIEEDSSRRKCWREIDRVGNVYNRAVAFPAGILHSATQHFGSCTSEGRIYHSFHFAVDWHSLNGKRPVLRNRTATQNGSAWQN